MKKINTSLAPWLSVRGSAAAVDFYTRAFSARVTYKIEDPDGNVVARLSIDGAEFWVSDEAPDHGSYAPTTINGGTVRMILIVADPDAVFRQALDAGAKEIHPIGEEHGWRIGRLADPFGHHWEIGYELDNGSH